MSDQTDFGLKTFLTKETVRVGVEVNTWEQAIEQAGSLLVQADKVEGSYVEAMKDTIRELGTYSVIAPGVAMPHARPVDGVLETCFALITLRNPIAFGSQLNDPVKIIIAFGALDKQLHIQALQQITQMIQNEALVRQIKASQSTQELLDALDTL